VPFLLRAQSPSGDVTGVRVPDIDELLSASVGHGPDTCHADEEPSRPLASERLGD